MSGLCVFLSKVDIQANRCADLDCVVNCDIGGNAEIFFIYWCEYINWAFLFVHKQTEM